MRRFAETVTERGEDSGQINARPWVLMSLPSTGFTPVALQCSIPGLTIPVK